MQSDLSVQVMPYISHVQLENFRGSVVGMLGENNREIVVDRYMYS